MNAIAPPLLKLLTAAGGLQPYRLSATQEVVIGREPDCQIVLDSNVHKGVSRRHATVRPLAQPNAFEVCDLGSGNGTYVNGERLQGCRLLQGGDRLTLGLGGPEFLFEAAPSAHALPTVNPGAKANNPDSVLTLNDIFPLLSTRQDLLKKAYLVPGLVTVLFVVALFGATTQGNPVRYILVLAVYLALAAYYFVYQLCGKRKPIWEIVGAGVVEAVILASPLFTIAVIIFRRLLPGNINAALESGNVISIFISFLFGAGFLEELLKALPIFLALWLGRRLGKPRLGVTEPLDGILLGTAAAVGFTLVETLTQYVPGVIQSVGSKYGEGAGLLFGLQLLIPRVLGSIAGHMAYSGYFGYFIGLAALKPSKRWQLLAIGYLTAAVLHALWNTFSSFGALWQLLVGALSYVFLVAAILKARTLSPTRSDNFATRFMP